MFTDAYVDLMFAWGHARLGDADTARQFAAQAAERLHPTVDAAKPYPQVDPAHAWLLDAFTFRIDEALAGRPHGGPWPDELIRRLHRIDESRRFATMNAQYVVDRFRQISRILEPVEEIDPYVPWRKYPGYGAVVGDLAKKGPPKQLSSRVREFCDRIGREGDVLDQLEAHRSLIACDHISASEVGAEVADRARVFSLSCLDRRWTDDPAVPALFARHRPPPGEGASKEDHAEYQANAADPGRWVESSIYIHASWLHHTTLSVAGRMGWRELVKAHTDDVLRRSIGPAHDWLAQSRQNLGKVLMRLSMAADATRLSNERRDIELANYRVSGTAQRLGLCLGTAALNLWLGRPDQAMEVLDLACRALGRFDKPVAALDVAGEYLHCLMHVDWPDRRFRLETILNVLPRFPNSFTTHGWYSRLHVHVVDRVIAAIVLPRFNPSEPLAAPTTDEHLPSRREALTEIRAKLVKWGQPDWGPRPANSKRARPGHADAY